MCNFYCLVLGNCYPKSMEVDSPLCFFPMVTQVAHLGYYKDYQGRTRSYYGVLLLFHSRVYKWSRVSKSKLVYGDIYARLYTELRMIQSLRFDFKLLLTQAVKGARSLFYNYYMLFNLPSRLNLHCKVVTIGRPPFQLFLRVNTQQKCC